MRLCLCLSAGQLRGSSPSRLGHIIPHLLPCEGARTRDKWPALITVSAPLPQLHSRQKTVTIYEPCDADAADDDDDGDDYACDEDDADDDDAVAATAAPADAAVITAAARQKHLDPRVNIVRRQLLNGLNKTLLRRGGFAEGGQIYEGSRRGRGIYGGYTQGVKSAMTVKWVCFILRSFQTKRLCRRGRRRFQATSAK